jgi:hypothetical protein
MELRGATKWTFHVCLDASGLSTQRFHGFLCLWHICANTHPHTFFMRIIDDLTSAPCMYITVVS